MAHHKPETTLRKGWTTGACACAAAVAALEALETGHFPNPVTIRLPRGRTTAFTLSRQNLTAGSACAGVIKDAGDDPDVTHGAEIIATLTPGRPGAGMCFHAGDGVGTVTLRGLPLAVGEAAINPVPRRIIMDNLRATTRRQGTALDLDITLSIPGGQALAEKTMNGRLGIKGGLSVLGTTGVVIPYSCSSWIHSIHQGIDVARANNLTHIAAATGSTSEAAVSKFYHLPPMALIDMGDFAGGLLKHLRRHPVPRLTLAGGFAKLTKLAQGNMDLHSSRSAVDFARLARSVADLGGGADVVASVRTANTALEALALATAADLALADRMAAQAREVALAVLSGDTELEVMVFGRDGDLTGHAG